jgi:hypothetical protein
MGASSATPVEKLRDKQWVERHGHTASIMDYARFNWVAQPEDKIGEKGLFPRIDDYDLWAIKWGYQYRPEFKDPHAEKKALRAEVTKALANPRLWWIGDEGRGQDPRSQTEDLGDNSMKASDYGIKNLQRVVQNLEKWTAQPDGQYDDLNEMHRSVRAQFMRYTNHVQKNIGGKLVNNRPGLKPNDYAPKALQKEAVEWMGRQMFTAPLWLYPASIVEKLGVDAVDEIQTRQQTVLAYLLSPGMIYNMQRNALSSSDPYPADEYLNDVFATVWRPLDAKEEQQNDYLRRLQRTYVQFLGNMLNPSEKEQNSVTVNARRSDAILYVEQHFNKLEQYLRQQPAGSDLNGLHYQSLLRQMKIIREKYESGK